MARWHSCNVLHLGRENLRLWQFAADNGLFSLTREESLPPAGPLPAKVVAKDWRALWQHKLNVAWLPGDKVFLRVLHLPACDFPETLSMVELQLEKLSPLPVTHVVWSIERAKSREPGLQTVIVIMVARSLVEEFLGQLEGQGYLADRLEVPFLDLLFATRVEGDGAWIYPQASGEKTICLAAWWYGGVLRNLGIVHLPPGENRAQVLQEQLRQMTWAGELEGWLAAPPRWHLVADEATAALWRPLFEQIGLSPLGVLAPLPEPQLAGLTAQRAARAEPKANLLPQEFTTRYHQQFIDRLWMRSLGAVVLAYLVGVLIYFGVLQVLKFQHHGVTSRVAGLSQSYTNALQLKDRVRVLQEQLNLKFAALDCWLAAVEQLPDGLTLNYLVFKRGETFTLSGTAPQGESSKVTEYYGALRGRVVNGQPLFSKIEPPTTALRSGGPGGQFISWTLTCTINRTESE